VSAAPVVIEVRGLEKAFRIPERRFDSLKERATHPLTWVGYREHRALRNVTFDVRKGEFFGIVGRNGSGKSSLLKILASIYRADGGRARIAGRVAPFIELGVGFNHELTARENGVLTGVLMGLTLREARSRLDAVVEFAELEDFVDLQLKNYSSGMLVRLAFALMVQADADVMLIDEVLAVGDAAFARKCMDVFREKREAGKTIVLVTHDMTTVQTLCHRAMLLHDGELQFIGEPEDAALAYYRVNFAAGDADVQLEGRGKLVDVLARIGTARLRGADGEVTEALAEGEPIGLDLRLEAARLLTRPIFTFHVRNDRGQTVFELERRLEAEVPEGRRIAFDGAVENRLLPGSYTLDAYIGEDLGGPSVTVQGLRLLQFSVEGTTEAQGVISAHSDVEAVLE
jgi:ABC-type polysaccharide/polyol phosphate transport system ATPase subunit